MQLYLMRHAQSENNEIMDANIKDFKDTEGLKTYEKQRFADAPLSRRGRQQAKKLGDFLLRSYLSADTATHQDRFQFNDFGFTHVFVSPMIRTMDTIKPFAEQVDLQPTIWEEIHEQGGVWNIDPSNGQRIGLPGVTPEYIRANYPNYLVPDSLNEDGWWSRPYEEPEACYKRSGKVLKKLLEEHGDSDHRILLVTHSYFLNCLFYQLFNLSAANREFLFVLNNASISRIDFKYRRQVRVYQNRDDFLASDLSTRTASARNRCGRP